MSRLRNFLRPRARGQKGLTLFEMLVSLILLGIVSAMLSPSFRILLTAKDIAYKDRQAFMNSQLSLAMLDYAENPPVVTTGTTVATGSLPAPYSRNAAPPNRFNYAPSAPLSGSLSVSQRERSLETYALRRSVPMHEINDDGTTNGNVRVYQRVEKIPADIRMSFETGPMVTLEYDLGVIYSTRCGRGDTACNTSGVPPSSNRASSTLYTESNYTTWQPPSDAIGVTYVSTLGLQKKMLTQTVTRLERIRDQMLKFREARGQFPVPSGGAQYSTYSTQCHTVWYRLDTTLAGDVTNDIPQQIGLTDDGDGRTAWGAKIEYCPDFDPGYPTKLKAPNTGPVYAALRIAKNVSRGRQNEDELGDGEDPSQYATMSF